MCGRVVTGFEGLARARIANRDFSGARCRIAPLGAGFAALMFCSITGACAGGQFLEALSACPAPSKLSVARSRKRRVDPNMERPITIVLAATLVGWLGSTGSGLARIGHRRAAFIFALRTYD